MAAAINLSNVQRVNGLIGEALDGAGRADGGPVPGRLRPWAPLQLRLQRQPGTAARRLSGDVAEAPRRLNEIALAGLDQRLTRGRPRLSPWS